MLTSIIRKTNIMSKTNFYQLNKEKCREDYWSLDFGLDDPYPEWVRMSFLTWNQLIRVLANLQSRQGLNRGRTILTEDFQDVEWNSVRIYNETELDELVDKDGLTKGELDDEKDFVGICSKREDLFGSMHQANADSIRAGKCDPADFHKGWKDSPLVDYDEVVEQVKEDLEYDEVA